MGPLIFLALVSAILVVIGFLIYGMFLGLASLGQQLRRVWQELIPVESPSLVLQTSGGPVAVAAAHCWDVKGCSEESKAACPAVKHPEQPCWLSWMQHNSQHRLKPQCLTCGQFDLQAMLGQA
jgi:hypothetical protein